ncbi:MAG: CbiX/SirB N-terminal domain-containing protein [Planctomycetaceae bacterium]
MNRSADAAPVTAVIIVDHGSRKAASNEMLRQAAARFAEQTEWPIVEPAHMELAEPSIAAAFRKCVERGARRVIVFPYFLSPGRHWSEDIPELTRQAAQHHPGVSWLVTAPFGLHPDMTAIINSRIQQCLAAAGTSGRCDVCEGTLSGCQSSAIEKP